jgi:NAD-dependent SIR2 family protein deacetylase
MGVVNPHPHPAAVPALARAGDDLARFLDRHRRTFVLTGAGVSTGSGIPDYRDRDGNWKRRPPVQFGPFVREPDVRRRYWARSLLGWPGFAASRPGPAHHALARIDDGRIAGLVTQNVDGLHQQAGSRGVIDLHGRLDVVVCLDCNERSGRHAVQRRLEQRNPSIAARTAPAAPDGDADLDGVALDAFDVPDCTRCGGLLKPDVVFFGESVPRERVARAFDALAAADAALIVGSSLMVWSGFRFAREAARAGRPIAAVNLGHTRADDLLSLKIDADCGAVLQAAASRILGEI